MKKSTRVRFLWLLIVIFCVWQLLRVPAVNYPLWVFCTTGVLPITHKTLPPEAVWRLLIGLFVASFMLIFKREIIASFPHFAKKTLPQNASPVPATTPVVTQSSAAKPVAMARRLPTLRVPSFVVSYPRRLTGVSGLHVKHAVRLGAQSLRTIYGILAPIIRKFVIAVVAVSVALWQLIEPHLRVFDKCIEQVLRSHKVTSEMLNFIEFFWKTTKDSYQKVDARSKRVRQHS